MKIIYLILLLGLIIPSCSNSKDDLLEQVRKSVSVELNKKNLQVYGLETEVTKLDLVKKGGNEYIGILTTHEIRKKGSIYYNSKDTSDNDFNFEYDVYVVSDGDKFQYEIGGKRPKSK
jgi:hypothetical protein